MRLVGVSIYLLPPNVTEATAAVAMFHEILAESVKVCDTTLTVPGLMLPDNEMLLIVIEPLAMLLAES